MTILFVNRLNNRLSYIFVLITINFSGSSLSAGSISAIVFFILLIMLAFGWTGYAYFFPHSASGQFLIRVSVLVENVVKIFV